MGPIFSGTNYHYYMHECLLAYHNLFLKYVFKIFQLLLTAFEGLKFCRQSLFDCPSRHRLRDGSNWQLRQLIMPCEKSVETGKGSLHLSIIKGLWNNMVADSVLMMTGALSATFINLTRLQRCRKLIRKDTILRKDLAMKLVLEKG